VFADAVTLSVVPKYPAVFKVFVKLIVVAGAVA